MTWDALVAGTSVKTYAHIASWDGLLMAAPFRGADLVVPSRRGQTFTAKEYDAYTFSVPLVLNGATQAATQDNLDALRSLCDTSHAAKTLTRTKPTAAGDLSTTCSATLSLSEPAMVNGLLTGRVVLTVTNLDGCWYGAAAAPTIPATLTVAGTARTNKMTLVLPGAGTLTNSTLGVSLALTGSGSRTLDVRAKTTTGTLAQITASGDAFGNWFTLAPGSNVITWSGAGTPTISYQPAFR